MLGPLLPFDHDTLHPTQGFSTESVTDGLLGQSEVEPLAVTLGAAGAVPMPTVTVLEAALVPQMFVTDAV